MASRTAIVTGAASGIGRAIAQRLIDDDFDVLAVDLKPADDGPGVPHAADLTTREGNRGAVEAAIEHFGRLDAIVPNAGFQHVSPIAEFPEDRWDGLIAVLLTSPFLLARYGWEHLTRERRRALRRDRLRPRARGLALQGRLRRGQARRDRPGPDARARGRRARHPRQRGLPRLRPHAAGREADPRPGEGARRLRGGGARAGDPRAARRQAADRARGGRRASSRSCSAPTAARSSGAPVSMDLGWTAR